MYISSNKYGRAFATLTCLMLFGGVCLPPIVHGAEADCKSVTYCSSTDSDPDGDGWGWESKKSCVMPGSAHDPNRGKSCGKPAPVPAQSQLNSNFFYFFNGEITGGRGFTIGDSKNWNTPVVGLRGTSATGKLTVKPEDYQGTGDALHAVWNRNKTLGQLSLYGPPLNIAAAKDAAALVVDIQLKRKPTSSVTFSLDCEWPCRGDFEAAHILRKMPIKQWAALPIPLNCFRGKTFDLSKINGIFLLSTDGRLDLSLANIRLERLGEGDRGCAD